MENFELRRVLLKLGICSDVQGHTFIIEGVNLIKKLQIPINISEVYKDIANQYNTTSSKVERAIRYITEISYRKGDILKLIYNKEPDNKQLLCDLVFNFDIFYDLCFKNNYNEGKINNLK